MLKEFKRQSKNSKIKSKQNKKLKESGKKTILHWDSEPKIQIELKLRSKIVIFKVLFIKKIWIQNLIEHKRFFLISESNWMN